MYTKMNRRNIKEMSYKELLQFIHDAEEPAYRARQIWQWMYQKSAVSFDTMHNLPHSLREKLHNTFFITSPKITWWT